MRAKSKTLPMDTTEAPFSSFVIKAYVDIIILIVETAQTVINIGFHGLIVRRDLSGI